MESIIKSIIGKAGRSVSVAPDIDKNLLEKALKNICGNTNLPKNKVLAVADATVFQGATTGIVFMGDELYFANEKSCVNRIAYSDLTTAVYNTDKDKSSYSLGDHITFTLKDGTQTEMVQCLMGLDCHVVLRLLQELINANLSGIEYISSIQDIPLGEMPEDAKLTYIKLLYNYFWLRGYFIGEENEPDNFQLAMRKIVARIGLKPETRFQVRKYTVDPQERDKTNFLLIGLRDSKAVSYDIVRYSLLQDIMYLDYHTFDDYSSSKNDVFEKLQKTLEVSNEQVDLMKYAIDIKEQLITPKKGDLANQLHDLSNRLNRVQTLAESKRLPFMALMCSGSVYSVDNNMRAKRNAASISKQRELMLQAVIRNSQKAVNDLVLDMNEVCKELILATRANDRNEAKIDKLAAALSRFTSHANRVANEADAAESQLKSEDNRP